MRALDLRLEMKANSQLGVIAGEIQKIRTMMTEGNILCSPLKVKSVAEDSIDKDNSLTLEVDGKLVGGDLSTTVDPNEFDKSDISDEHIENTNKCEPTEVEGKLSTEQGPILKNDDGCDEELTKVPTPDDNQIHVSDNTGKPDDTESLNTSDHSKDSSNCDSKIDTTTDSILTGKNCNLDPPNLGHSKRTNIRKYVCMFEFVIILLFFLGAPVQICSKLLPRLGEETLSSKMTDVLHTLNRDIFPVRKFTIII